MVFMGITGNFVYYGELKVEKLKVEGKKFKELKN